MHLYLEYDIDNPDTYSTRDETMEVMG